ncbi:hypothetical protein B0H63DRAFT_487184 [Podospora didyma]|uniref:NADP-dependent oxidoreductase domain-containing protein n=1 Tax=Podospora didyma TaxID=330526 RepID=A0AAE0K6D3_9PEZI|nr:hypothetical protein B0H63DRAFT_487184 [Podospora didyma]
MILPANFSLGSEGYTIPSIGLGTFQSDPKICPAGSVKQSVLAALFAGYRHIDTCLRYGEGQGGERSWRGNPREWYPERGDFCCNQAVSPSPCRLSNGFEQAIITNRWFAKGECLPRS